MKPNPKVQVLRKIVIKVYVPAIMGASGITLEQAKTCFYYCAVTYLVPDEIDIMPILVIMGPHGTGKTNLLEQLARMVNEPKPIAAESSPTFRDKLHKTITALIDEGDTINEKYLIRRYDKKTGELSHKLMLEKEGWSTVETKLFGATIIVRRTPFQDAATSSRSIFIRTIYNDGQYKIRDFEKVQVNLSKIAHAASLEQKTSNRVRDSWKPLQAIAECLGDEEWLEYSKQEIAKSLKSLRAGQNYEPEQALLMVLREKMITVVEGKDTLINDVWLKEIRNDLKSEFDLHLKNFQIEEMCRVLGFKIKSHSGYPKVKNNHELLKKLLKERNL